MSRFGGQVKILELVVHKEARFVVALDHLRGLPAQLLGHGAERPVALAQALVAPGAVLDRLDEARLTAFDTQKLCVRLRSIEAVLGRRGDRRHQLALTP